MPNELLDLLEQGKPINVVTGEDGIGEQLRELALCCEEMAQTESIIALSGEVDELAEAVTVLVAALDIATSTIFEEKYDPEAVMAKCIKQAREAADAG